jgi:Arc/MetJ-type ribon-helix-helix transcriptional regulator
MLSRTLELRWVMTVELKPEQERIIQQQLTTGHFKSVDEVLATALASLPDVRHLDRDSRREAVQRMIEFPRSGSSNCRLAKE